MYITDDLYGYNMLKYTEMLFSQWICNRVRSCADVAKRLMEINQIVQSSMWVRLNCWLILYIYFWPLQQLFILSDDFWFVCSCHGTTRDYGWKLYNRYYAGKNRYGARLNTISSHSRGNYEEGETMMILRAAKKWVKKNRWLLYLPIAAPKIILFCWMY